MCCRVQSISTVTTCMTILVLSRWLSWWLMCRWPGASQVAMVAPSTGLFSSVWQLSACCCLFEACFLAPRWWLASGTWHLLVFCRLFKSLSWHSAVFQFPGIWCFRVWLCLGWYVSRLVYVSLCPAGDCVPAFGWGFYWCLGKDLLRSALLLSPLLFSASIQNKEEVRW